MRRFIAVILACVFFTQASGMASGQSVRVARFAGVAAAPLLPKAFTETFAAIATAIEDSNAIAILDGQGARYAAMHAAAPAFRFIPGDRTQRLGVVVGKIVPTALYGSPHYLIPAPMPRPTSDPLAMHPSNQQPPAACPLASKRIGLVYQRKGVSPQITCCTTGCSTPTPRPTATPIPTPTASPTPTPTPTPTPSPTPTPAPTPCPAGWSGSAPNCTAPTPTPAPTQAPTPSPTTQPTLAPTTTGINPWWTYEEGGIPGVGKWMLNIANGNLLVQSNDIDVAGRGIDLAFQRTYNSQSKHNASNSDGSMPSVFGNGWTNTFDAHMGYNPTLNVLYVWDIDGARYDYTSDGQGHWLPPAGQHTQLAFNGTCGYLWTKKTGTAYNFWAPYSECGTPQGYWGRASQILGRNNNNNVTFTYSWANNDPSNFENITQIIAKHSDSQQITLAFGKVNGLTELTSITRPDGLLVSYSYDNSGNLLEADRPAAAAGQVRSFATFTGTQYSTSVLPETYGYTSSVLTSVCNPRSVLASRNGLLNGANPGEGMCASFSYDPSSRLNLVNDWGITNFTPNDTTNAPLQGGLDLTWHVYSQVQFAYGLVNFAGQQATQIADSDGHVREWGFDSSGRVLTTQEWVTSTFNLYTNAAWDNDNNLVLQTDARGNETDYTYDTSGNVVQVTLPAVNTSSGSLRPTSRYVYNSKTNNLIAYCDAVYNTSHSTCSSNSLGASYFIWDSSDPQAPADPSEPYGRLTGVYSPAGYHTAIAYDVNAAGGDNGLPTDVTGDSIAENDGNTVSPTQHFSYDTYGNIIAYGKGYGTWQLAYDALNRLVTATDPDGVTRRTCYNADGTVSAKQSAYQYWLDGNVSCGPHSSLFTYDADGNEATEIDHYGQTASNNVSNGVTQKWYDSGDRLVETQQPSDQNLDNGVPWRTRYVYDLSQGNTVSINSSSGGAASFVAYGGLYKTENYFTLQWGAQSPTYAWYDVTGNAFDGLNRSIARYQHTPFGPLEKWINIYDANYVYGLLTSKQDPNGISTNLTYDALGKISQASYSDGATATKSYIYDPDGRTASVQSAGDATAETLQYNLDGLVSSHAEETGSTTTSPATTSYSYYANGWRSSLSVSSSAFTQDKEFSYSYRADGARTRLAVAGYTNPFSWTYSNAGRQLSQSDPLTGASAPAVSSWANGLTFVPRSVTYDAYGQSASITLPNTGAYAAIQHDVEGEPVGSSITVPQQQLPQPTAFEDNGQSTYVTSVGETYDVRGELNSENGYNALAPGGVPGTTSIHCFGHADAPGCLSGAVDPYTGAISKGSDVTIGYPNNLNCQTQAQSGNNQISDNWQFDAAGREVSQPAVSDGSSCDVNVGQSVEQRSYDAENHVLGDECAYGSGATATSLSIGCRNVVTCVLQQSTCNATHGYSVSYGYGPSGKARLFNDGTSAYSIHWDGAGIFFITDGNATLQQINIEDLGAIRVNPSTAAHMVVYDRDFGGHEVAIHTSTPELTNYGIYDSAWQWIVTPSRSNPVNPGSTTAYNIQGCFPHCGTPKQSATLLTAGIDYYSLFDSSRSDSYYLGGLNIQGIRAYDPGTEQWSTPDPYKGAVHDPMSQRGYMWNGNNPIAYADPSGYNPLVVLEGAEAAAAIVSALFTWYLVNAPAINAVVNDMVDGAGGSATSQVTRNAARGAAFETVMRVSIGGSKQTVFTGEGLRFVDQAFRDAHGNIIVAAELKSGNATLTKFIRDQIAKDASMLASGKAQAVVWIINGRASQKLLAALQAAGIQVVTSADRALSSATSTVTHTDGWVTRGPSL